VNSFRWVLAAALSALACQLAVVHATPIDRALPFLAVLTTILATLSYPSVMLGVPLLILAEIAIPDEGMRLMAFGMVMAVAIAVSPASRLRDGRLAAGVPLVAILLLRWIPFGDVLFGRELFLLAVALLIFLVLDSTPFAMAVAVLTVLVTPAVPLRTMAVPLLILSAAFAARVFGLPQIVLAWPSRVVVAFVILFFSWSGVVARAFPYFLLRANEPRERIVVAQALGPGRTVTLDVPEGAESLIVSGANVARLRRGVVLGRVEPGGLVIRIGDAADWGSLRREQFHDARNPLPRDPAGRIRGYGYSAWLDGAGRVALPVGLRQIRVIADAALPANAALQVEGFE
jgi:hypothetical protein